jgi:uncharacterized protein (UPF0276 family)
MQLTADLSDPLLDLIRAGRAPIDGVEVGPWFSVERIRGYRQSLPGLPFTFHGGDLIERVGWLPGAVTRIAAYQQAAGGAWVSMHLTLWPPGAVWLIRRQRWRLPLPNFARAARRLAGQVRRLARALPVPVLLENVEPLSLAGDEAEVRPSLIEQVLAETGCGLVLDIAHACVAADALSMDAGAYLEALPLDRVRQVHVSGTRLRAGRLVDAHEPLAEDDYARLELVLARTRPEMVTLEYIREREALHQQLGRLRSILAGPQRRPCDGSLIGRF